MSQEDISQTYEIKENKTKRSQKKNSFRINCLMVFF